MSEENVELVRSAYAAFNRGDFDAVGRFFHPEIEWHPYLGVVDGNLYRGRDAILTMWMGLEVSAPVRSSPS